MIRYEKWPLGQWVGQATKPGQRRSPQFRSGFQDTIRLLGDEVEQLGGRLMVVQVDVRDGDVRKDGMLSARARVGAPGVRVAFESKHGPLTYATDRYTTWQANLRAIALSLQALRAVDRYGVSSRGEQYAGWSAIEARPAHSFASMDAAAQFIAEHSGNQYCDGGDLLNGPNEPHAPSVKALYRMAARRLHPDAGGDSSQMARLNEAYRMLGGGQ